LAAKNLFLILILEEKLSWHVLKFNIELFIKTRFCRQRKLVGKASGGKTRIGELWFQRISEHVIFKKFQNWKIEAWVKMYWKRIWLINVTYNFNFGRKSL